MWNRWRTYYVVEPYHDSSFTCDTAGQQAMLATALRKDRWIMVGFFVMTGSFGVMLLAGILSFLPGLGLGAILFVGAFLLDAVLLLTGRPRMCCSRCGDRMKTDWSPIRDERCGEYQICPRCRTYLYTYRMSR
jgi:hypothetical protein